jgi:hypothetical protein
MPAATGINPSPINRSSAMDRLDRTALQLLDSRMIRSETATHFSGSCSSLIVRACL